MANNEQRETSGATTRLLLTYVRERGGEPAAAQVIERAGTRWTAAELEDPARWFSHDTRLRLFEAAVAVLDDDSAIFDAGASLIRNGVNGLLRALVNSLGSPREAYRRISLTSKHFSTTSTLRIVECHSTTARIALRQRGGYEHSRLNCDYVRGLLSSLPELWGLPAAVVKETECESDGATECVFAVSWTAERQRLWRRRRRLVSDRKLSALRVQMQELQLAASDLVASEDVDSVLDRIVEHAETAASAAAYVLVLSGREGQEPKLRSSGLEPDAALKISEQLLAGEDLGGHAVVVDVASSRRTHGRLAAIYRDGRQPTGETRDLLGAYARHGASALDLLTALEDSRREERRAADLVAMSRELSSVTQPETVGQILADALPRIVGCRGASVMLWDAAQGTMRVVGESGGTPEECRALVTTSFRPDQIPEIVSLLTHHAPILVDSRTASPVLAALLAAIGSQSVIVMPLLAGDELLGVATAGFLGFIEGTPEHAGALVRVAGLTDQGAIALQNARLVETVRHQSQHDALTGLPNRVLFARLVDETLRASEHDSGTAILFCDLDRFKHINDGLGHAAGDELLRQVSARLRGEVRPSDTVGRLGGDEFAVLLTRIEDERQPFAVASRLVDALDEPFRIDGREVRITVSVGVAIHTGANGRGDRLLAASDSAMYIAKQSGRNQVAIAGESLARRIVPSLEAELGKAAENGELRLHFQPVVDVSGPNELTVVGAEALLRWHHPRLGLLAPGAFLPLAEEAGLVTELDLWALAAACRDLATWPEPAGGPLHVAVNLASSSLVDPRLVAAVRHAITHNGLEPSQLHLEVVESRSLVDLPGVIEHMDELRQLGVRISLDDFGTGYSTLAWLQALPVDQIKIDRSFIMQLPTHAASLAVVRGVLALARELGIEVIAEGVEEPEQLAMLQEIGCELVQGFLLGRPSAVFDQSDPVLGT